MRILDSPRERAQALVLALALTIMVALGPFATGLLGAVILDVIFGPSYRWLRRYVPRRPAAGVIALSAAVLLLLPVIALVLLAIDRAPQAIEDLRRSALLTRLADLRVGTIAVGAELERAGSGLVSWLSRRGLAYFGGATGATLQLAIALFGLYYLLISEGAGWRHVRDALPFSVASAERLRSRLRSVTEAMLLGVALTAIVQGAVVAIGFRLVGFDDVVFWGVVTAAASIFPLLGAAAVWLPGVLVLVGMQRYGAALVLLAIGAGIASTVDNVIRPMVYRRVSHIHPMTTIVGAFAGVAWLGITGLLIGPLALSYFFELVRIYRLEYGDGSSRPPSVVAREVPQAPAPLPV